MMGTLMNLVGRLLQRGRTEPAVNVEPVGEDLWRLRVVPMREAV